jgi:hypothetical protein
LKIATGHNGSSVSSVGSIGSIGSTKHFVGSLVRQLVGSSVGWFVGSLVQEKEKKSSIGSISLAKEKTVLLVQQKDSSISSD